MQCTADFCMRHYAGFSQIRSHIVIRRQLFDVGELNSSYLSDIITIQYNLCLKRRKFDGN